MLSVAASWPIVRADWGHMALKRSVLDDYN